MPRDWKHECFSLPDYLKSRQLRLSLAPQVACFKFLRLDLECL